MVTNEIKVVQVVDKIVDIHDHVLGMLDGEEYSIQLNTQNIGVSRQFHNNANVGSAIQILEPTMLPLPYLYGGVNDPFVQKGLEGEEYMGQVQCWHGWKVARCKHRG